MTQIEEIKKCLGAGDYTRIGRMCGVSRKYARILLGRPTADKHAVVLEAARKIALFNRENGAV